MAIKKNEEEVYDLIIIGSGIAGLTAGLYAGRYRMKTVIFGGVFGGEGTTAGVTHNYPGFMEIDGYDLMMKIKEQVDALSVPIETGTVTRVEKRGHCFTITVGNQQYTSNTIIFATGTHYRTLGLPQEEEFKGKGLHYCVTCDGPLYRDKVVAIVGGGDAAVKGVNLIAEYAKKIYLIVRENETHAEPINSEEMTALGDKVEIVYETEVTEFIGDPFVSGVKLSKPYKGLDTLSVQGVFVEIGSVPDVALAQSIGVELDDRGFIQVDAMMKSSVDGVFACGDIVNHFGAFKQYITGAALGAVAATSAYNDHKQHGDLCDMHAIPHMVDSQALAKQVAAKK